MEAQRNMALLAVGLPEHLSWHQLLENVVCSQLYLGHIMRWRLVGAVQAEAENENMDSAEAEAGEQNIY